ncbi:non-ribosomal peptide synthetase [Micromonospora antibiotica]|uniref:Amino acid adenylation domain-containing protein n=1 Tax=Micromonospora antibiotica TaxID=2807623 RepID=A0ABS3VGQ3_9ACTN|nr:non-ribosomal peptide synthetase [Micromonospora antibiotica]MBO4164715.1 amino acid adenylation domain-containing protein [Micromonospora antibiotica]
MTEAPVNSVDSTDSAELPLSFAQEQLWFLDQLAPGTPTYNVAVLYRIDGDLDHSALQTAMTRVVANHDILRARFDAHDGVPYQVIAAPPEQALVIDDHTAAGELGETRALDAATTLARTPFDLAVGPLYRFRLFRVTTERHLLSIVIHHIVCDGWSINLISDEIRRSYAAIRQGHELPAGRAATDYADFVKAQRVAFEDGTFEAQLTYWKSQLSGLPALNLPADHPRPPYTVHRGEHLSRVFPASTGATARRLARSQKVSLSMLLTAALGVVLSRYTGEEDLAVGTTALGRSDPDLEQVVGIFVNAVVLRLDLSGKPTFAELLDRVKDTSLRAYELQDVPFERVVDRLAVPRDPSRNPLFDVLLQVLSEETGSGSLDLPGATISVVDQQTMHSRFDLSLTFAESATELRVSAEYSTELFARWRIEQLLTHIERVLTGAAADPGIRVSEIDLLSADDRAELMRLGHGPDDAVRSDPVHVLVAERAAAAPDSVAAVFEGVELTYGELDRRAAVLAAHLRHRCGVRHEELVGVAMDRGLDVLVAFLGVAKAGAAYVILDIDHPVGRLEFILDDTDAHVVLTTSDLLASLPEPRSRRYLCLDRDWPDIESAGAGGAGDPLDEVSTGDSLVSVIYTSGSTGRPKGVLTEHRALVSYLVPFAETFKFGPGDRILQFASLAFDLCQAEVYTALISGATLVCARRETLHSTESLSALIRAEHITFVGAPPTLLALLDDGPYPHLRHVFTGGEACPAELANRWNVAGRTFVNGYGPTEAAIGVTLHVVPRGEYRTSPPIGGPITGRRFYVVDEQLALVPVGVPGELLIGGDEGLARGYLNRPDLHSEKFIPDPFRSTGRVYRTGDLVRWNREGHLEFLGRIDTQIKLRGLRIEVEEIEAVLRTHPAVDTAAVKLAEDARGQQILAGYVTLTGSTEPSVAELRRHAAQFLPSYMVPQAWRVLESLPMSLSGKLNRRALPAPAAYVQADREVVALATPTERQVAAVFADVLGMAAWRLSADDDFFELGGNSLQAMRVISRVNQAFSAKLGVRTLYGSPNLRDFAQQVHLQAVAPPAADPAAEPPHQQAGPPADALSLAQTIALAMTDVLVSPATPAAVTDNLFALGADEEHAAKLLQLIEQRVGTRITARDLYTPVVLAAAVQARRAADQQADTWSPLVTLAAAPNDGTYPPLFCVPGASGSPSIFAGVARRLSPERTIIGLEAPGLEPGQHALPDVVALAGRFVAAIRERQPTGPYHLLGWSMGGLVAFEMARQLTEAGAPVPFLTVVDTPLPDPSRTPDDRRTVEQFVADIAAVAGRDAPELPPGYQGLPDQFDALYALLRDTVLPAEIGPDQLGCRLSVYRASVRATFRYRPAWTYPGRLSVLRTPGSVPAGQWAPLAATVREYRAPGTHHSMWSGEHRPVLAAVIDTLLAAAGE